ncbi:putative uncharacterized protein [Prevotella sp. CAG:873]|jgi:uncharacterized protein YdeI (BOF family)|nr:putative uncharacterized protein [Prevotella sp. CAG:873]
MKKSLIYIYTALLALAGSVSLSSCDDDFERPPMVVPTAKRHANTTIAELKTKFYTGESNYATLVEKRDDGTDYIIKGRVISSDQAGNFFKQLVIEDETGAIQVNIDSYDLYKSYQYGQEIVIDVTGLYVGAYGKLMQIGSTPNNNYPGRIASDLAAKQIEVNGLAEPEKIVAGEYTIAALNDLISNQEEFLAKQCRLVSIKDVTFKDAGKATLADKDKNTSRTISDGTGDMIVYTSGYSDFYDYYCPEGKGTIVGILSFFNRSWQIRLIGVSEDENVADTMRGLIGYELSKAPGTGGDTPTPTPTPGDAGTKEKPYTVANVQAGATGTGVWVKGYIVGWIDGKTLADGAKFNADGVTVSSNVMLADAADAATTAKIIPVQLPSGEIRKAVNLQDNPANYKKEVLLKGNLVAYFGVPGLKEVSAAVIDGKEYPMGGDDQPSGDVVTSLDENFDASTDIPAGWFQKQAAGDKAWYVRNFSENNYITMSGFKGTAPFDQWLLSPAIDMDKVSDKTLTFDTQVNGYGATTTTLKVYIVTDPANLATATELKATFATAPAAGADGKTKYSEWVKSGNVDLAKYKGKVYIAFRYQASKDANYATWCVDNVKLNAAK